MPSSTADIKDSLQAVGLLHATDAATPLNLNGGTLTAGAGTFSGTLSQTGTTLGFRNVTPVTMPSSTADIKDSLQAVGLLHGTDAATPLNLNGGALTAGAITSIPNSFNDQWEFLSPTLRSTRSADSTQGGLVLRRSRGTLSSPTQVQANDVIGAISFDGRDNSSNWAWTGQIVLAATQAFTSTARGSRLDFHVTSDNDSSPGAYKMRLDQDGHLLIKGGFTANGKTKFSTPTYEPLTGTADRDTSWSTSGISLVQLAQRVKAMLDDLRSMGLFD